MAVFLSYRCIQCLAVVLGFAPWAHAGDAQLQRCGRCAMTESEREAALRPDAVSLYPYLPARRWTAAQRIADLRQQRPPVKGRPL